MGYKGDSYMDSGFFYVPSMDCGYFGPPPLPLRDTIQPDTIIINKGFEFLGFGAKTKEYRSIEEPFEVSKKEEKNDS